MTDFDQDRRRQEAQRREDAAARARDRADHRAAGGEAGWSAGGSASTGLRIVVVVAAGIVGGVLGIFAGPLVGLGVAAAVGGGGWLAAGRLGAGTTALPAALRGAHERALAAIDAADLEPARRRALLADLERARDEAAAGGDPAALAAFEDQVRRLVEALPSSATESAGAALGRAVDALEDRARADAELEEALREGAPPGVSARSGETA